MDPTECRKPGHDWQPTDAENVDVCARCGTVRRVNATGWHYTYEPKPNPEREIR